MAKFYWDIIRWETEFAFGSLNEYFDLIEGQFKSLKKKEKEKIPSEPPPGMDEEEYSEWRADLDYHTIQFDLVFPSRLFYSFIVLLFIELESQIQIICDEIGKRNNLSIREKHLKGSVFKRMKLFLNKIVNIPLSEIDQEVWQWLKDLQNIRDCIVHSNGNIEKSRDQKRLLELCEKDIGISNNEDYLIIDQTYCKQSLSVVKKFFDQLFQKAGFGPSVPKLEE